MSDAPIGAEDRGIAVPRPGCDLARKSGFRATGRRGAAAIADEGHASTWHALQVSEKRSAQVRPGRHLTRVTVSALPLVPDRDSDLPSALC